MSSITLPTVTAAVPMSRVMARRAVTVSCMKVPASTVEETRSNRRDIVFTAAIVAACSIAKVAMADEEPGRGTEEAKKKYGPICVAMPTARICHK
ncbi:hypothetical protein vseg_021698 [Gypsophila vaccaria]